jgi:hypothetical protein
MKKKFTTKLTNAVEPAAPTHVWGKRPCPGKGGKTQNSSIVANSIKKENE